MTQSVSGCKPPESWMPWPSLSWDTLRSEGRCKASCKIQWLEAPAAVWPAMGHQTPNFWHYDPKQATAYAAYVSIVGMCEPQTRNKFEDLWTWLKPPSSKHKSSTPSASCKKRCSWRWCASLALKLSKSEMSRCRWASAETVWTCGMIRRFLLGENNFREQWGFI